MIAIIVAQAKNRVIGASNEMPWYLPADLKHFKELTNGHAVIMGRKTFDSILARIGKPLPNRQNIVVTRNPDFETHGAEKAFSLQEALLQAKGETVFIAGGAEIYRQALPLADTIYLTQIEAEFDGDTFFPEFSEKDWQKTSEEKHPKDEKNPYDFSWITLTRQAS